MNLKEVSKWVNYLNEKAMEANKALGNTYKYVVMTRLWNDNFEVTFFIGGKVVHTITAYFATGGILDEKAEQNFEDMEFKIAEFKVNCLNVKAC